MSITAADFLSKNTGASITKFAEKDKPGGLDSCHIGIEIEVEGTSAMPSSKYWHATNDDSLRNGIEYLSVPIIGEDIKKALDYVSAHIRKNRGRMTSRTSVHVHMDAGQLDYHQIVKWVTLAVIFEKSLFLAAGSDRLYNNHCVPNSECGLSMTALLRCRSMAGLAGAASRWNKYTAVNIASLLLYGTVEFRHMEGTNDIKRIQGWVECLMRIRDYAITTPGTVQDLVDEVCPSFERLYRLAFNRKPSEDEFSWAVDKAREVQVQLVRHEIKRVGMSAEPEEEEVMEDPRRPARPRVPTRDRGIADRMLGMRAAGIGLDSMAPLPPGSVITDDTSRDMSLQEQLAQSRAILARMRGES